MRFDGSCCHNLLPVTNQSWNISVFVTTKVGFDSIPVALWITDIHVLWKWCLLTGYISVKRLKRLLEKRWRLDAFQAPVRLFSPWRLKVSTALSPTRQGGERPKGHVQKLGRKVKHYWSCKHLKLFCSTFYSWGFLHGAKLVTETTPIWTKLSTRLNILSHTLKPNIQKKY